MKTKSLKRFVSGLLAALMVFALLPAPAWGMGYHSGTCGPNATWCIDGDDLIISGTGEVTSTPWKDYEYISVTVESGITSLCDYAFDDESVFTVSLPDTLLTIGEYAFRSTALRSVTIPPQVTTIGERAFSLCDALTSVTMGNNSSPSAPTAIGDWAFSGCKKLDSVTMGPGIRSIGNAAFYGCESLTTLAIPFNVRSIGERVFMRCTSLQSITVANRNRNYKVDDEGFLYTKDMTELLYCPVTYAGAYTVPDTVTKIDAGAFAGSDLTSITIPDSVTALREYTFFDCFNLAEVNFGKSLTTIGDRAFTGCYDLTTVTLPDGLVDVGGWAFSTSGLTTIVIPDSVASLGRFSLSSDYLTDVYYTGTEEQWNNIAVDEIGPNIRASATIHYNYVPAPDAPDLSADIDPATGRIRLSWDAVDGAEKYLIYRRGESSQTFRQLDSTTDTTYTDAIAAPGSLYYYQVVAVAKRNTRSDYSNSVARIATCAAPKVSSANVSTGGIKLTWSAVNGASEYAIYRCTDGENYDYYDSTTNTTYTNKSVTPGQTYYYKVMAICAESLSGNSILSNAAYRTADCAAPKVSSSNVSTGGIKLTWKSVDGASKYNIYRCTDGKSYKFYDSTTKTTYTNKSVTPGTTYYYKLVAVCGKSSYGNSAYSNVANRTADCIAPKVSSNVSTGGIKLTWNAVEGASKYYIYRCTDGENYKFYDSTTKTTYTNKSVTPGQTYYYKLVAVCGKSSYGNSAYSNVASRTADCVTPTLTVQLSSGGKPQLKWSAIDGASKYYIYRSTDGKSFSFFDSTTKLSYTNTGAKSGTTYYYKLVAVCAKSTYGNSAYSNIVSIKSK